MADPRIAHPWRSLTTISWVAIASIALALIVVVAAARPLLEADIWAEAPVLNVDGVTTDPADPDGGDDRGVSGITQDRLVQYAAVVDNRSIFFTPEKPVRPEAPKPTTVQPKPVAPPTYAGPSLAGILGNRIYFGESLGGGSGHKWIDIGVAGTTSRGDAIKVIEIKDPWIARIAWKGGEYDVPLFDPSKRSTGEARPSLMGNNAVIRTGGDTRRSVTGGPAPRGRPAASPDGDVLDLGLPRGEGIFMEIEEGTSN